jgi:geranylgeranylglycerol-phosphate geranylgeranyltransferase
MCFIYKNTSLVLIMLNRNVVQNWWDLSRGGNIIFGITTVTLGAFMMGVTYQESIVTLALHSFCIAAFIASWFSINDLLDIEVDRINHPDRPLPSENISKESARKYGHRMMILSGVGLVAIILNDEKGIEGLAWVDSVIVWLMALLLMIIYELDGKPFNPSLKKRMFWGNLTIAGTISITILFGAAAINHATNPLLWLVAASAMALTTAREICMDSNDRFGDYDRTTLPRVIGLQKTRKTVWILAVAAALLMLLPFAFKLLPSNMILLILPAIVCIISSKPFLTRGSDAEAAEVLRAGMVFGLVGLALCGMIINR